MKKLLIIFILFFGCVTEPKDDPVTKPVIQPVINGTYQYTEAAFTITISFYSDFTFLGRNEPYGLQAALFTGKWRLMDKQLCLADDCELTKEITDKGFYWYDGSEWFYWRKI